MIFDAFCAALCSPKPFITVEVTPPHGASMDKLIEQIKDFDLHLIIMKSKL